MQASMKKWVFNQTQCLRLVIEPEHSFVATIAQMVDDPGLFYQSAARLQICRSNAIDVLYLQLDGKTVVFELSRSRRHTGNSEDEVGMILSRRQTIGNHCALIVAVSFEYQMFLCRCIQIKLFRLLSRLNYVYCVSLPEAFITLIL